MKNRKIKYTLLGFVLGIVTVAVVSFFLLTYFIGKTAADAATGIVKAKQQWKEAGVDPIDSIKNIATEFVEKELSKDSTAQDSTRVN